LVNQESHGCELSPPALSPFSALRVALWPPAPLSPSSGGPAGRSEWEGGGRPSSVHSSLGLDVSCVVSGGMPWGGESPAQVSSGGGLAMEFAVVAWAWSLWPLLGLAMVQPLNKLSGSQSLDLDLGFMVGFFCRSTIAWPVECLPSLARRGDEELKRRSLWFARRLSLHLGSREAAPGSVPTVAPCQPLYSEVIG
jgi:hypothetical protein